MPWRPSFLNRSNATPAGAPAPARASLPPIERFEPEVDLSAFEIRDERTVGAALQDLAERGDRITLYPADGGEPLAGRLVAVESAERRIVVHAEPSRMPAAGPVVIVGKPRGFRLQFEALLAWQEQPGPVLVGAGAWPAAVVHLQRRRFARLDAPFGTSLRAEFMAHDRRRVMSVDDVSLGGIGLLGPVRDHRDLLPKHRIERARLVLGQPAPLLVTLEICSRRPYRSFLAGEQLHFGCRFIDLAPDARAVLEQVIGGLGQSAG